MREEAAQEGGVRGAKGRGPGKVRQIVESRSHGKEQKHAPGFAEGTKRSLNKTASN